jgi:chromosome segregation ATPase
LEKEVFGKEIETALASEGARDELSAQKESLDADKGSPRWALQTISSQYAESLTRRESLSHQLETLTVEIEARKSEIAQRKENLARRRSDAESAKYQLEEREAGTLASVQNTSKRVEHVWHNLHNKTAESRIYLCREVANLYGLRKATKKGQDRELYVLGGGFVVDLREMNGKLPF